MIVPYIRVICNESMKNSQECIEFVDKPVLTFLRWDLDRQASFILHQALIIRYMENLSSKSLSAPVAEYKKFLMDAKIRFDLTVNLRTTDEDATKYNKISLILSFLLGYINSSNNFNYDDISFYVKQLDLKGGFYKAATSFAEAYLTHLKILGDKINVSKESILDQDERLLPMSSIPVITIDGRHIVTRYISLGSYSFNPKLMREHVDMLESGLDFLACCNWTGKKFLHAVGYLGTLVWDFNPRHFKGNLPLSTYYHIHRILFNLKSNIQTVTTNNYPQTHWFKQNFIDFLKILRVEYDVEFDAPQILGRILSGDESSNQNNLSNYLISGIGNPNSVSAEDYKAFLDSDFKFDELDIQKGNASTEADDDLTDDLDVEEPTDAEDTTDDKSSDDGNEPPADDEASEDTGDPEGEPADSNADEDPTEDDSTDEPEPNIDTSDETGIAFELSEEETLDSVIYRREISIYIAHLLAEKNLPSEKLEILKKLKMYWLNLLSVKTIQDIIKSVKHV